MAVELRHHLAQEPRLVAIGKEVIVHPTDTDENLTAEMLGATDAFEYVDPG